MKKKLNDILVCPDCHSKLNLKTELAQGENITKGKLSCKNCSKEYPILEGIPRLASVDCGQKEDKHKEVCQANEVYHDMIAELYEEDESLAGSHNEFNQKRIENIVKTISQQTNNDWFLDLACGTGNVLKFGQNCFKNAVGVDISIGMLKKAQSKGLEVIQADILKLPFKDEVFNSASCFSVLHHLYDQKPFFKETYRVLAKNGILYTDWDPVARPKIDKDGFKWKMFITAKEVFKFFVKPWLGVEKEEEKLNYRQINPASCETYKKAEYHLPSGGEGGDGVDFNRIRPELLSAGYKQAKPTFHWNGKDFSQLSLKQKAHFRAMQALGFLPKNFAENIQMIIKK